MVNYKDRGDRFSELVGLELRGAMSSRGYVAHHVASQIDIHAVTLSRYLNGHRILPSSVVSSVAEVIGVAPDEIVTRAYSRLLAELGPVSGGDYTIAARDENDDDESQAQQQEP